MKWQGIPDESIIGYINLKTIRLNRVKQYYKNYFGLVPSSIETDSGLFSFKWLSPTSRSE